MAPGSRRLLPDRRDLNNMGSTTSAMSSSAATGADNSDPVRSESTRSRRRRVRYANVLDSGSDSSRTSRRPGDRGERD